MGTVCPQGHDSASGDFCDVCGMRISSSLSRPDGMLGKHHAAGRFVASGGDSCARCGIGRDRSVLRGVRIPGFRPPAFRPSRRSGGAFLPCSRRGVEDGTVRFGILRPARIAVPADFQVRATVFGLEQAAAVPRPARRRPARRRRPHPAAASPPGLQFRRRLTCQRHPRRRKRPGWRACSNRCSRRPPGLRRRLRPRLPLWRHRLRRHRLQSPPTPTPPAARPEPSYPAPAPVSRPEPPTGPQVRLEPAPAVQAGARACAPARALRTAVLV